MACFEPAPQAHHCPSGTTQLWDDLHVYISSPPSPTSAAVILVSDVFGWESPLFRKLADKVAADGFFVVVPDLLYGDAYDPACTEDREQWRAKHSPEGKPMEDLKKIVEDLESKGITAIGVAGFCWGAKVVITCKESIIKAVVLLHPSRVTIEDIKAVQVPTAILAAETDHSTPVSVIEEFQTALASQAGVEHFVKVYPGVVHGWTVRYDPNDEEVVKKAEEAHTDMIAWFQKHLKGTV